MFDKNMQYINIIRNQQNIKIDYKVLNKNVISKNEQSIFLLENEAMSNDAKLKLSLLENNISKTLISAISEDINQEIVSNETIIANDKHSIMFDRKHNIILDKISVSNCKNFYNDGEIDYLISPFSILQDILNQNLIAKSLNLFILNNKIYSIILDEDKRLIYNNIGKIIQYNELENESFFEDEISKQKLYEEMYLLELQTYIEDLSKNFYEQNEDKFFIESINIFYSIKQLNNIQVNTLNTNLMIDVNYSQINIEDIMYKLTNKQDILKISYTKPRKKKKKNSITSILISLILLTGIVAAGVFYYKKFIYKEDTKKVKIKKEINIKEIALPMHKKINTNINDLLSSLFDTIGKEEVLKEIRVQKDESTLICTLKNQDSYNTDLKPKLLKLYENSDDILTSQNKNTLLYTIIISNTKLKKDNSIKRIKLYKPNNKYLILDKKQSKMYLEKLLKNSTITLSEIKVKKYTKYIFNVQTKISSPVNFYNIISKINEQYYSIVLDYPIEFTKQNENIIVKYTLIFNQIKKQKKEEL